MAGFVNVKVRNEAGEEIKVFYRDTSEILFNGSKKIFIRSEPSELFGYVCKDFRDGYCIPHTFTTWSPEILIEVWSPDKKYQFAEYKEGLKFEVNDGLQFVRATTTLQVDGATTIERTAISSSATPPSPTFKEGTDEMGQFQFYRIDLFDDVGFWAFRYHKRYTYSLVVCELTHVKKDEQDSVILCIPQSLKTLLRFLPSNKSENQFVITENELTSLSNTAVEGAMQGALSGLLKYSFGLKDAFGRSLLAGNAANLIYIAASEKEQLDLASFLEPTIKWATVRFICIRAGIALESGPGIGIAMAVGIGLKKAKEEYLSSRMNRDFISSKLDDIVFATDHEKFFLYNRAKALHNVRIGLMEAGVLEMLNSESVENLPDGYSFLFSSFSDDSNLLQPSIQQKVLVFDLYLTEGIPVHAEVALNSLALTSLSEIYSRLYVSLEPKNIWLSGAAWSVNDVWIANPYSSVLPGTYQLRFKPISGWQTPPPQFMRIELTSTPYYRKGIYSVSPLVTIPQETPKPHPPSNIQIVN